MGDCLTGDSCVELAFLGPLESGSSLFDIFIRPPFASRLGADTVNANGTENKLNLKLAVWRCSSNRIDVDCCNGHVREGVLNRNDLWCSRWGRWDGTGLDGEATLSQSEVAELQAAVILPPHGSVPKKTRLNGRDRSPEEVVEHIESLVGREATDATLRGFKERVEMSRP